MSLIDANWAPQVTVMLHDGKEISNEKNAELKALFIEGLIRFLDIYAQTEIGEGIQIDMTKIALHINSPSFENDDLYAIHSIEDVFKFCETLAIAGLPLWRFLRLSKYQSRIFESGYHELLISLKKKTAEEKPCYGCVWYQEEETFIGTLRKCSKPETEDIFSAKRRGPHNPNEIKICKWLTTLDHIPKAAECLPEHNISRFDYKGNFFKALESARARFKKELEADPFRIPKTLPKEAVIDLNETYDPMMDFCLAFGNKRTNTERQGELRKAMYIEGMVRFFENFAQCELGSSYVANIKNIALFVGGLENSELSHIKNFEDVYSDLEQKILDGFNVEFFVKFDLTIA